jgi:LysM repeat protein
MTPTNQGVMMPDTTSIADPYRVQKSDTLSAIAKRCGSTVAELQRYNKIANPNQLEIGQTLYLSKETAFGVSFLFLDALRHPIENLPYQLHFDGKMVQGTTDQTGAVLDKVTESAHSKVEVWIKNGDNQWQQLASTVSGYGHKLITAVSGFVVFKGQTEILPDGATPKPVAGLAATPAATGSTQAPPPKLSTGAPSKNNPHVKHKKHKGPQGQSIITVGVDLPDGLMQLFQNYTGEKITEDNWTDTAAQLICEKEVLKAFAQVESKGAAFKRINSHNHSGIIPTILYERHIFHRLTCANGPATFKTDPKTGKYLRHPKTGKKLPNHGEGVSGCLSPHDKYPDLCYPSQFVSTVDKKGHATLHTDNSRMPDGKVEETDQYGARSYLRLINAYRLDAFSALKACSWGKFQVMGNEHLTSGGLKLVDFMKMMCSSEVKQLEILQNFIENKAGGRLLKAVREKDWHNMALYYNGENADGPGSYSFRLKDAYEKLKKDAA